MGLMKKIHNNPKLSEARMPLFLQESGQERWLSESFNQYQIKPLVSEISSIQLQAHTVKPLGGKYALGNIKQSSQEHIYPELSSSLKLDL